MVWVFILWGQILGGGFSGVDDDQVIGNWFVCLTQFLSCVCGIEFLGFAAVEVYPLCIGWKHSVGSFIVCFISKHCTSF